MRSVESFLVRARYNHGLISGTFTRVRDILDPEGARDPHVILFRTAAGYRAKTHPNRDLIICFMDKEF